MDFLPVGIEPILISLAHDAKGRFRDGQDRVRNRLLFSSVVASGGLSNGFESSFN